VNNVTVTPTTPSIAAPSTPPAPTPSAPITSSGGS
jgi:hypothetical protein